VGVYLLGVPMSITDNDRKDYKQGQDDAKKGVVETAALVDIPVNHPDTAPYYKGREGEQLDADKKEDDDKSTEKK
jgi:hypothetical protein